MSAERSLNATPIIASLKNHLETIRRSELKRIRRRFGSLTPDQEVAIESMTHGIVNRIVDIPISALANSTSEAEATTFVAMVVRLFNLPPNKEYLSGS